MRNVVNISLPVTMVKEIEHSVKQGSYSSKSEFFRMLIRLWMEGKLAKELDESRRGMIAGKGKRLRSLKDLR